MCRYESITICPYSYISIIFYLFGRYINCINDRSAALVHKRNNRN
nr:MAG TPA: hypothetical protein [Bacteriophage sp.]